MPNCHAETMAVGGVASGCADEDSSSARASATANRATFSVESAWGVESALAESEAGPALSEVEAFLSAVKAVRITIISHSNKIAPNTSPIPNAVICKAISITNLQSLITNYYTGMFPCFLGGAGAYLSRSAESEAMIFGRDSRGSMMSST